MRGGKNWKISATKELVRQPARKRFASMPTLFSWPLPFAWTTPSGISIRILPRSLADVSTAHSFPFGKERDGMMVRL
jgi:hypothetical protein